MQNNFVAASNNWWLTYKHNSTSIAFHHVKNAKLLSSFFVLLCFIFFPFCLDTCFSFIVTSCQRNPTLLFSEFVSISNILWTVVYDQCSSENISTTQYIISWFSFFNPFLSYCFVHLIIITLFEMQLCVKTKPIFFFEEYYTIECITYFVWIIFTEYDAFIPLNALLTITAVYHLPSKYKYTLFVHVMW